MAGLLVGLALVLVATPAHAGTRVALVIGVTHYQAMGALANPRRDADLVARELANAGFAVRELVADADTGREAVTREVLDFQERSVSAEAAVVYFSGHGIQLDGTNWLLPADVRTQSPNAVRATAISSTLLKEAVKGASRLRLVILDACRDNPFAVGSGWDGGNKAAQTRGLIREKADNVVLLFATQAGATAEEGQTANSPFATALAEAIATPGLGAVGLPSRIAERMASAGVNEQPDQMGILPDNGWAFHPGAMRDNPGPTDAAAWAEAFRANTRTGFETYLSAWPTGLFATEARQRIAAFGQAAVMTDPYARWGLTKREYQELDDKKLLEHVGVSSRFNELLAAAQSGDVVAQCLAGLAYYYGLGTSQNFDSALQWFSKSAKPSNLRIPENTIGFMFENGQGIVKNYQEAMNWYHKAADRGSSGAMNNIGEIYYTGKDVTKDYAEAMNWFHKSADSGNAEAMNNIGEIYYYGNGVTKDYAEAINWFHKAADRGISRAMKNIGEIYYYGNGVTKDYAEAVRWFRLGAQLGDPGGMRLLGFSYDIGQGVAQDYAEAMRWYSKAAELGDSQAMGNIGLMFGTGRGVAQNYTEARRWYQKAVALGNEDAKKNLAALQAAGH